jgi:hypothetical protein
VKFCGNGGKTGGLWAKETKSSRGGDRSLVWPSGGWLAVRVGLRVRWPGGRDRFRFLGLGFFLYYLPNVQNYPPFVCVEDQYFYKN